MVCSSIRQAPDIDLKAFDTPSKSLGIGDQERQIEFAGNPEQRFGHSRQRMLSRIPLPIHAGGVIQPAASSVR